MKKVSNNNNYQYSDKLIIEESKLNLDKLFKKYNTSKYGISVVDVDDKINKYGKNIMDTKVLRK